MPSWRSDGGAPGAHVEGLGRAELGDCVVRRAGGGAERGDHRRSSRPHAERGLLAGGGRRPDAARRRVVAAIAARKLQQRAAEVRVRQSWKSPNMPDALLLVAALVCTVIGMGWLALAMDVHWKQVRATPPFAAHRHRSPRARRGVVGGLARSLPAGRHRDHGGARLDDVVSRRGGDDRARAEPEAANAGAAGRGISAIAVTRRA